MDSFHTISTPIEGTVNTRSSSSRSGSSGSIEYKFKLVPTYITLVSSDPDPFEDSSDI